MFLLFSLLLVRISSRYLSPFLSRDLSFVARTQRMCFSAFGTLLESQHAISIGGAISVFSRRVLPTAIFVVRSSFGIPADIDERSINSNRVRIHRLALNLPTSLPFFFSFPLFFSLRA